ncbi:MAG: nitrite reductase small subunit NirD [Acidobacteria bacterium]|nr:nitrite reductase small subunit NirD [Acidobacteriota bacterium]
MTNARWIRITSSTNIPPREGRPVRLEDGREIAIFNLGDRFLAVDNRCPHSGGPLCDGIVTGASVVCPLHAWRINLQTGAVDRPGGAACVQSYPVRVDEGVVLVEVPDRAAIAKQGAAA